MVCLFKISSLANQPLSSRSIALRACLKQRSFVVAHDLGPGLDHPGLDSMLGFSPLPHSVSIIPGATFLTRGGCQLSAALTTRSIKRATMPPKLCRWHLRKGR